MMITGDHPRTACSIARQIGLPNPDQYLLGEDLNSLSDEALAERLKSTQIFARVVPEQKLRLVKALQAQGATVAMTGDGVNDAPALKEAHIGIAMGQRGTDVAREAADLVLLDDDFTSIVTSIRMGRRIYRNLQNAVSYLLAVHIPIAGIAVIPLFFKMPLILTPIHIALLHLIIEPACSVAFEAEPALGDAMAMPPRHARERLFSRPMMLPTLLKGLSILLALFGVFYLGLNHQGQLADGETNARTLTFMTLMAANMGLIASHRLSHVWLRRDKHSAPNPALRWVLLLSLALMIGGPLIPEVRQLLHFAAVDLHDALIATFVGAGSSLWPLILSRKVRH
jgi:Ca2+-transporting ATPase